MKNVFDEFYWHSAIGIDEELNVNKNFVVKMANTDNNRSNFIQAGDNLLVHKTTQALWRITDDMDSIEPVFGSDILTEDDINNWQG